MSIEETRRAPGEDNDIDDKRRHEVALMFVHRGQSAHTSAHEADAYVRELRRMRERDYAEAARFAGLPEHEWTKEALVAALEAARDEAARLGRSFDHACGRLSELEDENKALKAKAEAPPEGPP